MRQIRLYHRLRAFGGLSVRGAYRQLLAARYAGSVTAVPQSDHPCSILVIRGDAIGDLILFLPALGILRRHYEGAKLSLLVGSDAAEFAAVFAPVDEVIPLDRKRYRFNLAYRVHLIHSLRDRHFDLAVNPLYSREPFTDELLYCSGARERIVSEGDLNNIDPRTRAANNQYCTHILPASPALLQESQRNREFVEQLTGTRISAQEFQPWLPVSEALLREGYDLLNGQGLDPHRDLIVAVSPGASNAIKVWPAAHFARLVDLLAERFGARVVLCGSRSDQTWGQQVSRLVHVPLTSLIGKTTLAQLAAVLRLCALYIGNDSGPLHIAVASGTPSLGIVGGGHFRRFYPYGDPSRHRMTFKEMDCYNCNWKCIHKTVRCIDEISLDQVWQETMSIMEGVVLQRHPSAIGRAV